MVRILSFDCAVKHMGVCCAEFDTEWIKKLNTTTLKFNETYDVEQYINDCNEIVNNAFVVTTLRNIDFVPGKKLKQIKKLKLIQSMSTVLNQLDTVVGDVDIVLMECQPATNGPSTSVCDVLVYHYLQKPNKPLIDIVSALFKNRISLGPNLDYQTYQDRGYSSSYTTNKSHTRENFKYWCDMYDIDLKKVDKPVNDIADAFMQIMGWCPRNPKLLFT
jgi:hypothetical protein